MQTFVFLEKSAENDFDHERSIVFSISEYHLFENLRQKDDERNNTKKTPPTEFYYTHCQSPHPSPHPLDIVEMRRGVKKQKMPKRNKSEMKTKIAKFLFGFFFRFDLQRKRQRIILKIASIQPTTTTISISVCRLATVASLAAVMHKWRRPLDAKKSTGNDDHDDGEF